MEEWRSERNRNKWLASLELFKSRLLKFNRNLLTVYKKAFKSIGRNYEDLVYLLCICVVQVRITNGAEIDTTFGRMPVTGLRAGQGGTDGMITLPHPVSIGTVKPQVAAPFKWFPLISPMEYFNKKWSQWARHVLTPNRVTSKLCRTRGAARTVRGQPSVDEVVGVRIPRLPLHDIGLGGFVRQRYSRHLR